MTSREREGEGERQRERVEGGTGRASPNKKQK